MRGTIATCYCAFIMMLVAVQPSLADSISVEKALDLIANHSTKICPYVSTETSASSASIQGRVSAELNNLMKSLAAAGMNIDLSLSEEITKGPVRTDIAMLVLSGDKCRNDVSKRLEESILPRITIQNQSRLFMNPSYDPSGSSGRNRLVECSRILEKVREIKNLIERTSREANEAKRRYEDFSSRQDEFIGSYRSYILQNPTRNYHEISDKYINEMRRLHDEATLMVKKESELNIAMISLTQKKEGCVSDGTIPPYVQ